MKKFSDSHEWIEDGRVGITSYAQQEIGEIVFVALPKVGSRLEVGDEVAVLESTKAAVDIYCPVSGEITAVNEALKENPDLINQSPEKEGWIFQIKTSDPLDTLLEEKEYLELIGQS